MSTRTRRSVAPTATAPSPSQGRPSSTATRFEYERPQFTLNPDAQRALADLVRKHNLSKLDKGLQDAQDAVTVSAGEINDRLKDKENASVKLRARVQQQQKQEGGGGDDADVEAFEADLAQMKVKVEAMTKRMEEGMRKMIDGQHAIMAMREKVSGAAESAREGASTQASTLNTRSQGRRRRGEGAEEEDEGAEEYQDFTPTDPAGGTQAVPSISETWMQQVDDAKTKYQNFTMQQRYAQNNNYRNFKGIVHGARYPDGEVELPHESAWFDEAGAVPEPGVTRAGADDDEDDDDIQIQRAKTSTKCPLTLQEFKEPLTSTKCKHSFEASAILEMIKNSQETVGGRPGPRGRMTGGEKAVRCPVGSCDSMLTENDLHKDKVIIHHIMRLQRAKRLEEEEAEDDEEGEENSARPQLIDSDAPGPDDYRRPVKREPRASGMSRAPASSPPDGLDEDGDATREQW